jgi:hypothetical protein
VCPCAYTVVSTDGRRVSALEIDSKQLSPERSRGQISPPQGQKANLSKVTYICIRIPSTPARRAISEPKPGCSGAGAFDHGHGPPGPI